MSIRILLSLMALSAVVTIAPQSADAETPMTGPEDPQAKTDVGPVDKDLPHQWEETPEGLRYRILREGDGDRPTASDTVSAHYKGWLDDETIFDSSYRRGQPTSFPLNRVIPGWTIGLQKVAEGGMIELDIPSDLGYGSRGAPGAVPPNARLHFLVELKDVQ